MPNCSVIGCDGRAKVRGMCHAHYCRSRLSGGDPGPATVHRRRRLSTGRIPQRDFHLRKRYGISLAEEAAMLDAQGGRCAICGSTDSGERSGSFHVDHCHETGRIRGLLCGPCNKGLGMLGDDPDRLLTAAAYLLQHRDILTEAPL